MMKSFEVRAIPPQGLQEQTRLPGNGIGLKDANHRGVRRSELLLPESEWGFKKADLDLGHNRFSYKH